VFGVHESANLCVLEFVQLWHDKCTEELPKHVKSQHIELNSPWPLIHTNSACFTWSVYEDNFESNDHHAAYMKHVDPWQLVKTSDGYRSHGLWISNTVPTACMRDAWKLRNTEHVQDTTFDKDICSMQWRLLYRWAAFTVMDHGPYTHNLSYQPFWKSA
jgi:hypothetical protein